MTRSFLIVSLLLIAGCSDLPTVDQYFTFNLVRTVNFPIPASISTDKDTSVSAIVRIDTAKEYGQNGTAAYLLRTSKITRIQLVSSVQSFSLANVASAILLFGPDTVGDSISVNAQGEYMLRAKGQDVTAMVRDTSYTATLSFSLRNSPATPVSIAAYMTFVNTALPQ